MIFVNPLYLGWLIILPYLLYRSSNMISGTISYPNLTEQTIVHTWRTRGSQAMPYLTLIALACLIIALARPQLGLKETLVHHEGLDILLALDVSTSMLAEDFEKLGKRVNRVTMVKEVTSNFIAKRPNDRIGLVVFAERPYILSPLTWDHDWTLSRMHEVESGMVEDGTAIGSALATAVNRLRASSAKSKVVVLLTDGNNNAGAISPATAAAAAKALKITVYTIGAGSKGAVPYPQQDQWGRKIYQMVKIDLDDELLKSVATTTGGKYFRATNSKSLQTIFQQIDRLEKSPITTPNYREYLELYPYFLIIALILLITETILVNTVLRRLP